MASLELRNQTYRVVLMFRGRKFGYSLDTGDRETAAALRGGVEKTLMLINQGAIAIPEGVDGVSFIKNGGKMIEEPKATAPPDPGAVLPAVPRNTRAGLDGSQQFGHGALTSRTLREDPGQALLHPGFDHG